MTDWRDDPDWRLVAFEDGALAETTNRPVAAAELAQPDGWASLYVPGRPRPVAIWSRVRDTGSAPSSPAGTIAVP